MFATPFPPTSPPAGHPARAAHARRASEAQQLTRSITEAQLARERLGAAAAAAAAATIAPTRSEAASDTNTTTTNTTNTTSRSQRSTDEDEDDPNTDLRADGSIYNYSEIHARVTQAAGHGSQISNGNTVMAPGRGGVGGSLALVLGVVVGALACSLWHSRKV
ncbi:tRNA-splicing endonuclease subunit sen54 [Hypoxylon texense]